MRLPKACTVIVLNFLTALGVAPADAPAWPHSITKGEAGVTVYQPQAISWPDLKTLTWRRLCREGWQRLSSHG